MKIVALTLVALGTGIIIAGIFNALYYPGDRNKRLERLGLIVNGVAFYIGAIPFWFGLPIWGIMLSIVVFLLLLVVGRAMYELVLSGMLRKRQ